MWGEEGLYLGREGEALYSVRGPGSKAVKFGKTLCRRCNDTRSQPFDAAYDEYWLHIQANGASLSSATHLDWRDVYGLDWEVKARALGAYTVKNAGCWMAESGFEPPAVFARFLDGGNLVDTRLMLSRQESASLAYRSMRLGRNGDFNRGIGVLPAAGWMDPEGIRLTGYELYAYISDICTRLNWSHNSGEADVFWTEPVVALELMPATVGQKMLAVRIGLRALGQRFTARRRAR